MKLEWGQNPKWCFLWWSSCWVCDSHSLLLQDPHGLLLHRVLHMKTEECRCFLRHRHAQIQSHLLPWRVRLSSSSADPCTSAARRPVGLFSSRWTRIWRPPEGGSEFGKYVCDVWGSWKTSTVSSSEKLFWELLWNFRDLNLFIFNQQDLFFLLLFFLMGKRCLLKHKEASLSNKSTPLFI